MDRVHSTSNLLQRRWASSVAQDQHSIRPTTASQRPVSSGRPISGYGNRLNSRMQSRPTTALSSHKPPPLFLHEPKPESSTQVSGHLRPASAVRPLSGRIFLRKTQEKGWVAKNVPEVSYEGLEIEDYDDIYDDTQSVDSFFDDDFDTEEQDEKLQRLLTCTTLGVASKGHKQDYVSGEVTVPKFHCPRCRDHYYGLTPFPCDEELARLIREGLWRTGEPTSPDKSIRRGMMRTSLSETNIQKNRKSSSNKGIESSSKLKLPPLNTNNSNMTSSDDTNQSNTGGSSSTTNHNKKRNKKISFALDNDCEASPSTSKTSLTGRDDSSNTKGRKRRIGDESKKGSLGSNKGSITSLNDTNTGSNSSLDRYRIAGHQKKLDNQSSTSKLINSQTDAKIPKDTGQSGNFLSSTTGSDDNSTNALGGEMSHGNSKDKAKGSGHMYMNTGTDSNGDGNSTTILIDQGTMTNSDGTAGTGSSNREIDNESDFVSHNGNSNTDSKYGDKSSESDGGGSGDGCKVVNCQNKTSSKLTAAADGSGKKAEKPMPGYMRAASPSQSDWGDPTHAKKWINNVAPPQPTFRYNNDIDDDDNFSSQVFNPCGWRQQKKPPKSNPDDPLLLPIGPKFTRAFTFSYMPSDNMGSNSTAGGSKKTRKKTK